MDYSNYNKSKEETWCSWPVILCALYFFFPLGIYLIIKKQTLHRRNIFTIEKKTFSSAISLLIYGLVIYLPKICYLIFDNNNNDLKIILDSSFYSRILKYGNLFIVLGIVVLLISFYQKYKGKKYRNYISLVVNKDIENLDEVSLKMKLNKKVVIRDLKNMIDKCYLENYELDENENRIYNITSEKMKKEELIKNTRLVKCPNCHANNKISEKIGKCEFCNSYIE